MGMIYAFSEAVGSRVRRLTLSPVLTEEQLDAILDDVELIADEFDLWIGARPPKIRFTGQQGTGKSPLIPGLARLDAPGVFHHGGDRGIVRGVSP